MARNSASLTEYLTAMDNPDASEPAKRTHREDHRGVWVEEGYEVLDEDPSDYRVECECGESFSTWQKAEDHTGREH